MKSVASDAPDRPFVERGPDPCVSGHVKRRRAFGAGLVVVLLVFGVLAGILVIGVA
jgi:hypothetical protein